MDLSKNVKSSGTKQSSSRREESTNPYISPNKHLMELYLSGKYDDCLSVIGLLDHRDIKKENQLKILKAGCWANLGINHVEVMRVLDEVIAVEPLNAFAYYGLGLSYYVNGDMEKCISPFTKAAQLNKKTMDRALQYKENAAKVLNLVETGKLQIIFLTSIKNCSISTAKTDFVAGEFCKAFENLKLTSAVDPSNNSIKRIVQELSDHFLKAIVESLEKEVLYDIDMETKMNHAEFLIKSNKLAEAVRILPVDNTSARYFYLNGLINYLFGALKASVRDLTKALELDGAMKEAEDLLGKAILYIDLIEGAATLSFLRNYSSACHNLSNALDVDIENKRVVQAIYFQRAVCKFHMGMHAESFLDYLKFESLQNETGMILNGIRF